MRFNFLTRQRVDFGEGEVTDRLNGQLETQTVDASSVMADSTTAFELPPALLPPLTPPAAGAPQSGAPSTPGTTPGKAVKLTARAKAGSKRRVTVSGSAPAGSKVTVAIMRGKKRMARKTVTVKAPKTAYKVVLKLKRKGKYIVRVTAAGQKASARVRVR
jgi:hypothetical protein